MPKNILIVPPQVPPRPPTVASVPSSFPRPTEPPSGWKPFFNEQGLASPAFIELLSAVFKRLDPNNTGTLTPEALAEYTSAQGYTGERNFCKP